MDSERVDETGDRGSMSELIFEVSGRLWMTFMTLAGEE